MGARVEPGEYLPDEFRALLERTPWAVGNTRITALADPRDGELLELVEEGCCLGGSAWTHRHYPRASPLVTGSQREGTLSIYSVRTGEAEPRLVPGLRPAGIGAVAVDAGAGEVRVTYHGLGGGGVGACVSRGLARGVLRVVVHEPAGGSLRSSATLVLPLREKLVLGVDDTDSKDEGSTWSLCHALGRALEGEGLGEYLLHSIVQLHPAVPERTQNCVATAITMGIPPGGRDGLLDRARELLGEWTLSRHTGMAWLHGLIAPPGLSLYARAAKSARVGEDEAFSVAGTLEPHGVGLGPVTGRRGCIGALAALAYHRDWGAAVGLPVLDP